MKSLKTLLTFFCYFGTGIVAVDTFLLKAIESEILNFSQATREITFFLFVILMVLKIIWFVYDKYLETQERNLNMDKTKEEIIDMKEDHEKDVSN